MSFGVAKVQPSLVQLDENGLAVPGWCRVPPHPDAAAAAMYFRPFIDHPVKNNVLLVWGLRTGMREISYLQCSTR